MRRTAAAAALLVIALSACQRQDPNNIAIDEGNNANADVETFPPDEGNDETAAANRGSGLNEADDVGSEQQSPPGRPGAE